MNNSTKNIITRERCEAILRDLIRINTENPLGNEMDIVKVILSYFSTEKLDYTVIDHGNNRASLVISIKGIDSNKSIAFLGHIDTVPSGSREQWTHPPFEGYVENGYMYGRGTSDMKGGVTSMIVTLLYFIENNITPPQDIHFCFTADEEVDGIGVVSMIEKGIIDNAKEVIICEPTSEAIGLAEKGALWLHVGVKGKLSHASMPDLGINAIEKVIMFIDALRKTIDTTVLHPLLGHTSLSVTQFSGGIKTNIVPDNADASIDIRTIPGQSHDDIINTAAAISKEMMNKYPGLVINIAVENNRAAVETMEDSNIVNKIKNIFNKLGHPIKCKGIYFYTDASQLIPHIKVPFVILGPGEDQMAHQNNERIELSSIVKLAEIYVNYILYIWQ